MRKSPLILLADDEPNVRQTLIEILEGEGFEAISVSDGASAVRWAREARPDIVICDVVMPALNGVEAAKQIKEFLPQACIILFTGQVAAGRTHKKGRRRRASFPGINQAAQSRCFVISHRPISGIFRSRICPQTRLIVLERSHFSLEFGDGMRVAQKGPTVMGKSDETARQLFVLVADDEPTLRSTIVEILRDEGYDAIAVEDGREAVEYARKVPPDIFLTDLAMPGMNGIEAAKQIKAFSPKTRVIFFSGHGSSSAWLAKAKNDGYDFEFIAKPIRPEALIRAIRCTAA